MQRLTTLYFLLALAAFTAGCASHPVPRVTRLGDGVYQSPSAQEAEAYCRNFGAPMRFLGPKRLATQTGDVTFRCD